MSRDHCAGNIGASTFRFSLAALLRENLRLLPKPGHNRARILNEDALSGWIRSNCRLSVAMADTPWVVEEAVIRQLNPPLNIRPGFHPFRDEVSAARRELERLCDCD
jgi:hypothetical protein